jgi:hypothetical protein
LKPGIPKARLVNHKRSLVERRDLLTTLRLAAVLLERHCERNSEARKCASELRTLARVLADARNAEIN